MARKILVLLPLLAGAAGGLAVLRGGPTLPAASVGDVRGSSDPEYIQPDRRRPIPDRPPLIPERATGTLQIRVTIQSAAAPGAHVAVREGCTPERMEFQTGEDGRQRIDRVPTGAYVVVVRHTRFIPQTLPIEIKPDQASWLDVDLKPGGQIQGTVTDLLGVPVGDAPVRLMNAEMQFPLDPELGTRTDAQGRYAIEGVPLEGTGLMIHHLHYRPWKMSGLKLRAPNDVLQIDAVLDAGITVTGMVHDADGRPIAGANVVATNDTSYMDTSDAEGRFSLHGMGPEPMRVTTHARGYGSRTLWGIPAAGGELRIRLSKAGTILGRLQANPLPKRLGMFLFRYEPAVGGETRVLAIKTRLWPTGEFRADDIDPGPYRIELESPGYETLDHPTVTVVSELASPEVTVLMRKRP